jgi:hypothetical protein
MYFLNHQPDLPPVADPNSPYSGMVGVAVTFDDSGFHDPGITVHALPRDFASEGMTGMGPTQTYTAARRQSAIAYARWELPSRIYGGGSARLAIGSTLSG